MCLNKHNHLVNIKYKINKEPDTNLNLNYINKIIYVF